MTPRILLVVLALLPALAQAQPARPNVLWIVSEDNTYATIGAYGMDANAVTPTIDGLAKQGVLYRHCFSQAPVCAPSRFTIITGVYATSAGPAHQMRARGNITPAIRGFSAYLREAGYYCTNNAKTDYNAPIDMKDAWDESSKKAHWRNRKPGQPFFAVFNHEATHESSVFGKVGPLADGTDPAKVNLPPYTPDTPETRADRALYHDNIRRMDNQVANLLKQLADDGLAEDTIVFYYGDNGGVLPRSKRFCYDSGLRVPLVVHFPKKWQHLAPAEAGGQVAAPVSFVDFAPTVLSLCGVEAPKHFEGKALMGPKKGPDSQYAFSFRARMDERYDLVRTVRSDRYRYTINYAPHVPYGARNQYQFQQKGYRAWKALFEAGKLEGIQKAFWMEKPAEEFYDVQADPHEVNNLAINPTPEVAARMKEMHEAIRQHMIRTRDNGLIPEGAPAEGYVAAKDASAYPVEAVIVAADLAIERDPKNLPKLVEGLRAENEVLRYWAAQGLMMLRGDAAPAKDVLTAVATNDASPRVRVPAAEALVWVAHKAPRSAAGTLPPGRTWDTKDRPAPADAGLADKGLAVLTELLAHENPRVRLQAANSLELLGRLAQPALPALKKAATGDGDDYVKRTTRYTAAMLAGEAAPTEEK